MFYSLLRNVASCPNDEGMERRVNMPGDMRQFNQAIVAEYRAQGGRLSGRMASSRLLLLTTTGARSGKPHTTPLGYGTDGDRLIVIASNNGAARDPDWYRNLSANPEATIELGSERFRVRARLFGGEERERVLPLALERVAFLASQQQLTERPIPIVVLERSA